jgi:hypothetical protein
MYKVWIVNDVTYPHRNRAWAVTRLSGLILRYDYTGISGVGSSPTTLDADAMNLTIAPIPVGEAMEVTFTLQKPGSCSIRLFDATGRMARSLDAGWLASGAHSLQLQRGDLPAGAYLLQVQTGNGSATRTVSVR